MIGIVIAFVVGGVAGFVGGYLFFRNNIKKLKAAEESAKKLARIVSK